MTNFQWNILCRFMYVMLQFVVSRSRFAESKSVEILIQDVLEEGRKSLNAVD